MCDRNFFQKVLMAYYFYKYRNRRQRSMYIRPIFLRRDILGESILTHELGREDPQYHHRYFRMDKDQFEYLLTRIGSRIYHSVTHIRPILPHDRLSITLRFLSTGNSQISLAMSYRISPSSVCNILRETMTAICEVLSPEFLSEPNKHEWLQIAEKFETRWNFINCCGAIDGKHIRIKAPRHSGSVYFNYKTFFSVVLLAVATADYRFAMVDIGSPGSVSDGGILKRSGIGTKMETGEFDLPPSKATAIGLMFPPVFIGDDAFPLKPYLMKPFAGRTTRDIPLSEKIFNYRLSRARMVVENTFGIFSARWRIFERPIDAEPDIVILIIKTCVILHNFLTSREDFSGITVDTEENGVFTQGNWRQVVEGDIGMQSIPQQGSNNSTRVAFDVRNKLKEYFVSQDGQVSWQEASVMLGFE